MVVGQRRRCKVGPGFEDLYTREFATRDPEVKLDVFIEENAPGVAAFITECLEDVELKNADLTPESVLYIVLIDSNNGGITKKFGSRRLFSMDAVLETVGAHLNSGADYTVCEVVIKYFRAGDSAMSNVLSGSGGPEEAKQAAKLFKIATGAGKKSIITVYTYGPDDHMCAQRSLVLLQAHLDRVKSPQLWEKVRKTRAKNPKSSEAKELTRLAVELSKRAGVDITTPSSNKDLEKLAAALSLELKKVCRIRVFDSNQSMEIVFSSDGSPHEEAQWFNLLLTSGHFQAITKVHTLLCNQRNFCDACGLTYSHEQSHVCKFKCQMCRCPENHFGRWLTDQDESQWLPCKCGRTFYGQVCFDRHKENPPTRKKPEKDMSDCALMWKCNVLCKKVFRRSEMTPEKHRCGSVKCKNCKEWNNPGEPHQCFMKVKPLRKPTEKYLFADFECTQDTGTHVVNLAVTYDFAGAAWPDHFTIDSWLDQLLSGKYAGYTILFHNGTVFVSGCLGVWVSTV